ncbi:MAG: hypothetical protein MJZ20_12300 [Bacteroidaceae bacterium]|nr:hypothetical protein [Bacteroidaceae bacterium]
MGCPYVVRIDEKSRCNMYYVSIRKDKKVWAHFPECASKNCPILHPELLKGATVPIEKCMLW